MKGVHPRAWNFLFRMINAVYFRHRLPFVILDFLKLVKWAQLLKLTTSLEIFDHSFLIDVTGNTLNKTNRRSTVFISIGVTSLVLMRLWKLAFASASFCVGVFKRLCVCFDTYVPVL
uniref:Uncharacterized protein n=1 Tax=Parascaris univalens TaxID=6257 RepID=A0A915BFH9_PARUN